MTKNEFLRLVVDRWNKMTFDEIICEIAELFHLGVTIARRK